MLTRAALAAGALAVLPVLVVLAPPGNAVAPGIDGRLVVVQNQGGHTDVVTMEPDGSDQVNLTAENKSYLVYHPQPSPDGQRIAYARSGAGADEIWVMDADGTDKTALVTSADGGGSQPAWSPDGSRLAFARSGDIWTVAADGSDPQKVADEGSWSLSAPEWSPSGTSLAYVHNDQAAGSRIFTEPATGGAATARTAYNDKVMRASWSPDGSTLLLWHDSGNLEGLYTMTPTGGGLTRIRPMASSALPTGAYAWSPQGSRVAFVSNEGGQRDVWVMDADGTDASQVTPSGDGTTYEWAVWSADLTRPTPLPEQRQGVAMTPYPLPFGGAGAATYDVSAGVLPPGLALSSDGVLTGTPTEWGSTVFQVTATDGVTTERTSYLLRVTDPDLPVAAVNNPAVSSATSHPVTGSLVQTVRWAGTDATSGVATYDVRVRRAPWNSTFKPFAYPAAWQGTAARQANHSLLAGNTYCYSARAVDRSGRKGGWSPERCTVAPLTEASLTRSSGWTRVTGSGYHGGAALATKTKNATLTRTGARLARVGLIATTCPSCGTVDVFVGATKIGRISLARGSSTLNRKPILLPRFGSRTGTVRVKVVTSGRMVRVDSLVVGAR